MLKVYNVTDYVSIDGADWREVGGYGYGVFDEEPKNELRLDNLTFTEAYEYLSQNCLSGVWNDNTFFRKKPIIRVSYNDALDPVNYRRFNKMSYKREFVEYKDVSLEWIIKHLSADQCIQYLKDRGMTTCPILK